MLIRAASQVMAMPTPVVVIRTPRMCGSLGITSPLTLATRMWVRTEIRVTSPLARNMRVDLRRSEVRVAEHLLDAP